MTEPLVDKEFLLEKYPGKGGWTYAAIPQVFQDKKAPFGWVRVKGLIDSYEIKNYHLMPMQNGKLFLPIKADIRKKTGKQAGDVVKVVLYADNDPVEIPQELLQCLLDEPGVHEIFVSLKEVEQKAFIDWIYAAKNEETKVQRIVKTFDKLIKGQKLADK